MSLDPSQRFLDLFSSIQAGKFFIIRTSSELSAAVLESVCIGLDKSNLSRVEKDLNVAEVCASFGHFVKFIVSVEKPGESSGVTVSRNAFAIMMRSQHSASQSTCGEDEEG